MKHFKTLKEITSSRKKTKRKNNIFNSKCKGLIDGLTAIVTLPQINNNYRSCICLYEEHYNLYIWQAKIKPLWIFLLHCLHKRTRSSLSSRFGLQRHNNNCITWVPLKQKQHDRCSCEHRGGLEPECCL